MLELRKVSKTYLLSENRYDVLKNLNISFREKELVCILGKSGSGKTTLLNIIGLLDQNFEGNIYINGKDITKYKELLSDKLIRSKIGFVFQDYKLLEDFSVFYNIKLSLMIKGEKNKTLKVLDVLRRCNILYLKDKTVNTLSGGEKQRVAIARCLVNNPDIILLDEPTGALDTANSKDILNLLKDIFFDKLVIMVTHDKNLAKKYSDRLIIINDGTVLYDSNPYVIKVNKKLFISNKKMTYIDNIKYSFKNLKRNRLINTIILVSLIISITLVSFILFIASGFKDIITEYEKNTFVNYPLLVTKKENNKKVLNKINRYDSSDNIYFNKDFVSKFEAYLLKNNVKYLIKYDYNFNVGNSKIDFSSYLDKNYLEANYELVAGTFPNNDNEVVINIINDYLVGNIFDYFNIKGSTCSYDFFINKEIYLSDIDKRLVIKGIVTPKDKILLNSFTEEGTILYNKNLDKLVPIKNEYSIYVYNKKEMVKLYLDVNKDIKYEEIGEKIKIYFNKMIISIESVFLVFSFISLFISSFLIFSMTYTRGIERKKEIGILKSLGARKKDIRRIFINEILIISIISMLISLFLVRISIPFINNILYNITSFNNIITFNEKIVLCVIIISVLTGGLGSLIPAFKNGNQDVLKCLK